MSRAEAELRAARGEAGPGALAERAGERILRMLAPARDAGYDVVNALAARIARHLGMPRLEAQLEKLADRLGAIEGRLDRLDGRAQAIERELEQAAAPRRGDEAADARLLEREGLDPLLLSRARARLEPTAPVDPADPLHDDFYWKHLPLFAQVSAEPARARLVVTNSTAAPPEPHDRLLLLGGLRGLYRAGSAPERAIALDELPHLAPRCDQALLFDERLAGYLLLRTAWLSLLALRCDTLLCNLRVTADSLGRAAIAAAVTPAGLVLSDGFARKRLHAAGLFEVQLCATYPRLDPPPPLGSRQHRDRDSFYFTDGAARPEPASSDGATVVATYLAKKTGERDPVTLLFYGYGTEFNLRPLAAHLAGRGHQVEVVDALDGGAADRLRALHGRDLVFFTSAHLERDRTVLAEVYPGVDAPSPLEILGLLRPRASFFYPHDLTTPVVLGEHLYLGLFDAVLAPSQEMHLYAAYCRAVETVGWIKLTPEVLAMPPGHDFVWLYSDFVHYFEKVGLPGLWDRCARAVERGVKVKFPAWPGAAEASAFFEERAPGSTLPPESNALELTFRARGVITNSLSSCLIEADLLGKPALNLTEPYHGADLQRRAFAQCRHALFADAAGDAELDRLAQAAPGERRLEPFDFAKCEAIVERAIAGW